MVYNEHEKASISELSFGKLHDASTASQDKRIIWYSRQISDACRFIEVLSTEKNNMRVWKNISHVRVHIRSRFYFY